VSASAQLIDEVVRAYVAPEMKDAGYRKSGRSWYADDGVVVRMLNIQGSSWNSPESARFTANLGLWFGAAAAIAGAAPVKNRRPPEYQCTVRQRIGFLMEPPRDMWWTLTGSADVLAAGEHVRSVVHDRALPWLDRLGDPVSAIEYLQAIDHAGHSPVASFSIALGIGDRDLARELYARWASKREPGLGGKIDEWAAAHGLLP
jgi:hypothetical protein